MKAHRLLDHSTLGLGVMKKKKKTAACAPPADPAPYRGTSLIRNSPLLGPYSRTVSRAL